MRTPLYSEHLRLGARMTEFAGWDMPLSYAGILEEHRRTRQSCSVFDTCHMGQIECSGPEAAVDLERLLTQRVGDLPVGRCRYGYLLREDGGVLDDLTCYRLGPERFRLIVNAGTRTSDFEWVRSHVSSGTLVEDLSAGMGKLDVQGPSSHAVLAAALGMPVPLLGYFRFVEMDSPCGRMLISRTGYTGEWGYEVYVPSDRTPELWRRLLASGAAPAGLGARDTLRLEMGYPLYGHELGVDRSPVAAAHGAFVDPGKAFIGRPRVERDLREGCDQHLVGIALEGRRAARAGDEVLADGREVGRVTSGAYGPSVETAIALAYVNRGWDAVGTPLSVRGRGAVLAGRVVALPFWTRGTARAGSPPV